MDISLLILELLIIIVYLLRYQLIDRLPDKYRSVYRNLISGMVFRIGKWYYTILIPILIIFVFYIGWVLFYSLFMGLFPRFPTSDPIPIYILTYVIVGPIAEQILQCLYLSMVCSTTQNKSIILFSMMAVAAFFAILHYNTGIESVMLRFVLFMMYGLLYYLNEKNILPSVIAHSSWNLIVISPLLY
jgi:membrane protease YdiL (CAAX protease family)